MAVYFIGGQSHADRGKREERIGAGNRSVKQSLRERPSGWSLRDIGSLAIQTVAVSYYAFIVLVAIVVVLLFRNPGGINSSSLWWFALLVINRTFGSIYSNNDPATEFARVAPMFGVQMVSYVVLFILAMTLPLPRLGITTSVMAVQWPSAVGHSGEVYNDQPWRFVAWGAAYYAAVAIGELFGIASSFTE
jgi:hypothetical protein